MPISPVTTIGTATATTTTDSLPSINTATATVRPTAASMATRAIGVEDWASDTATNKAATGTGIPMATTAVAILTKRHNGGTTRLGPTGTKKRRATTIRSSVTEGVHHPASQLRAGQHPNRRHNGRETKC